MSKDIKDKKWLVKKNNEILGPFSDEEVKEELSTGNFSILDSACLPDKQVWLCLNNYESFSEFRSEQKEPSGTVAQTLLSKITDTIFINTSTLTETSELDNDDATTQLVQDVSYKVVDEKWSFRKFVQKFVKKMDQKKVFLFSSIFVVLLIILFIVI